MTRFTTAVALGALILSSTTAFAATPAAHPTSVNYVERCNSLATQWQSAVDSHGMNRHLGKAKADAARGERLCKSSKISQQRRGVADYRAALKILRVRPA